MNLGTRTEDETLIDDLRDVERHAVGLFAANARLAARGQGAARFTAIPGGESYLDSWRTWVKSNLGLSW